MKERSYNLNEAEFRLMQENEKQRLQLEEVKTILNKRSSTQELSLKGAVETVLDERDEAEKKIYLIKQELKKLNSFLSTNNVQESKSYLNNLLIKFEQLYGAK